MSIAHTLLLIRPKHFGLNSSSKNINLLMDTIVDHTKDVKEKAVDEFENILNVLKLHSIKHIMFKDKKEELPESIFLSSWISVTPDGKLIIYPIKNLLRRLEKRQDIINYIIENFDVTEFIDLSDFELEKEYLEGNASVVFDHENKLAFCSLSSRSSEKVFNYLCQKIGYRGFVFTSTKINGQLIDHTDTILYIGKDFTLFCAESIEDALERNIIKKVLMETKRELIEINYNQLDQFAGNAIEVKNEQGERKLLMSETAYESLTQDQIHTIERFTEIIPIDIPIIESIGGGSARSLFADIHC